MWWMVGSALAWEQNIADWSANTAPVEEPFVLHTGSFSPIAGADEIEVVYQRALDTWNAESGADVYLEYGGRSTVTAQGGGDDASNVALFGTTSGDAALAITTWGYVGSTTNDCDTAYHARNSEGTIAWHVGEAGAPSGEYDLQHTMTHELGHCLGLGHSAASDAIMRAYNSDGTGEESRHLTDDDIAGMQAIYGAVVPELAYDGVTVTNTGDGTAWFVTGAWGGDASGTVDLGNLGADTPVGQRVGAEPVALSAEIPNLCEDLGGSGAWTLSLTDAVGNTWDFDGQIDADCARNDGGCASVPGGRVEGAALALIGLLVARRRR